MGTAREPVSESGRCPACSALVLNPKTRSSPLPLLVILQANVSSGIIPRLYDAATTTIELDGPVTRHSTVGEGKAGRDPGNRGEAWRPECTCFRIRGKGRCSAGERH